MSFLKTTTGAYVGLADVREARPGGTGEMLLRVETGAEYRVAAHEWDRARWAADHHVVPAAPGTMLLLPVLGCDRRWIVRQPVIAWAIAGRGWPEPITSTGVFRVEDNCPAFLHPCGVVEDALGHYASYEQWAAQLDEEDA